MEVVLEKVFVDVPKTDLTFFKEFANKMGWMIDTKDMFLSQYIKSRPRVIGLSEEDIMTEVRAIRYKQ
ncbi:MAG: hypothetical protein LBN93_04215 [Candidatus Symbiothrix sp.]|jgi:hypothetical protein|nr:hypothetical protein [Candidatus Symbiothrix sp.]